jgi:hypothetical protein
MVSLLPCFNMCLQALTVAQILAESFLEAMIMSWSAGDLSKMSSSAWP